MTRYRSFAALSLAAALAVASTADAQVGRYKRKTMAVKVQQTELTKGIAPKTKKQDRLPAPDITADQFMQIETKVQTIRDEQIKEYVELIKDTDPSDPELPDLLFRLAEQLAQKQRYYRFQAMDMYPKIEREKNRAKKRELQRKQQSYFQEEKEWLVKSIKIYKQIAENAKFKDYPRMDEALFYYAYTLQNAKYLEEARKVFYRLIKDYPNSKYIPDAYLAFAEYYFLQAVEKGDRGALANAEKFYDKVLQFPKSSVYPYALYKKGWVYINQSRHQDALETFFQVAEVTANDKRKAAINKAAKKDFVRAYAEVGKPQLAFKAFQRVDKKYAFTMLEVLGQIYLEQGKAEKTIYVFHELIGLAPRNKKVCEWQFTVVQAMLTAGTPDQKVTEVERLVKLYMHGREKNIIPEPELGECRESAQRITRELAQVWHQEAEKTLNVETLAYVDRLYKLYMNSFPEAPDYGEMTYWYAELLWRRADNEKNPRIATELWENAAIQFTKVLEDGKVKDPKLVKEAAYASVLGWKNALAVDPRTKVPEVDADEDDKASDKVPEPEPIPEREMKMVTAFDTYIKYIKDPKDEELVGMKFLKARTYWRYKHYAEAIPLFQDIVEHHLEHETAEWAAQLLLHSLEESKRYDELVKWVDIMLRKKQFLAEHPELNERLAQIASVSMRKAAEQLEKDGKFVECGERYREIFNHNPSAKGMDEVLYNAGYCYQQGKSFGLAITMREELIKRFPNSSHAKKALVLLGANYGAIAFYPQAAEKYEEYAKRFGGEKDASNALSNAVFYRRGIGQDDAAIKDTEFFVKQYRGKHTDDAADALFSMTGIYEKRGQRDMVVKHLTRYLREFGKKGGIDREIVAHARIGQILWEQSCPVKGVDGACYSVKRSRAIAQRRRSGKRRKGANLPTQCGPESKISLTVSRRKDRLVREAQGHFKQAIRLWGGGKAASRVPGDDEAAKALRTAQTVYWVAASNFYLGEEAYEAFLAIEFPEKLNFDPNKPKVAEDSKKTLLKWKDQKEKALMTAKREYLALLEFRGGGEHWAIAGASRVGQLYQNYSDALFTAQIPSNVRSGPYAEDATDAYCDELTTLANPLEEESVKDYAFCLEESTKRNWFNEWSQLCERELGQIRPLDFPSAVELHAEPDQVGTLLDRQPALSTIKQ